jgi:hypothetical protein
MRPSADPRRRARTAAQIARESVRQESAYEPFDEERLIDRVESFDSRTRFIVHGQILSSAPSPWGAEIEDDPEPIDGTDADQADRL